MQAQTARRVKVPCGVELFVPAQIIFTQLLTDA
jgi:hypothetical protein